MYFKLYDWYLRYLIESILYLSLSKVDREDLYLLGIDQY